VPERRRHAAETKVPVAQSRTEIDRMLRAWECDGVRWTDDYKGGRVVLEFVWEREGLAFMARFVIRMPIEGKPDQEWRRLHRVLRIYLLGQFNAIEAGLVTVDEVFLPFIVGPNDRTVSQQLVPRIHELIGKGAATLLPEMIE
jgi:hypothetical protein